MGKENELLEAARTGNIQNIERLLCYKSRKSTGPLNALASFRKNVNVNCIDTSGGTPLHLASLNGHRAAVELLLNNEANPNATDSRGCTSLHLAAWNGFSDICRALLTKGPAAALVNTQNSDGDTPLHSASQYGHCAAVAVLLENQADPSIRNLREESPLDLAAQYGRVETVQLLLRSQPELIHRVHLDKFPLHLAARNGHRQVVELLLDAGVNINTKVVSKTAGTALHEAAFFCKLDVVKLLLERGIDVTETDPQGQTALDLINSYRSQKYNQVSSLIIEFLDHGNRYAEATEPEPYYNSPSCRYSSAKEPGSVTHTTPSGLDSGGGSSQDSKISDIYSQPVRRRRKPPPPVPENASPPKEESPPPIPPRSPTLLKNLWQSTKFETMQEDNRSVGSVESIPGTLAHVQSVDATMTGRTSPQDMPRKPPRRRHPSPKINPDGKGSDSPSSLTQSYDGSSPLPEQSHSPYSIINPDSVFHSPYECRTSARDSDSHGNTEVVVMLNYESEPRSGVAGQKNAAILAEREGIAGGLPMRSSRTGCIREKPPLDHSLSHPHSTRPLKREKRKHRSESEAPTEISYAEVQKPIMVVVDSAEGELCNRSSRNITRIEVKTTPVKTTPLKVEVTDLSMGGVPHIGHLAEDKCRSESFSRRTPEPPSTHPHQTPRRTHSHVTTTTVAPAVMTTPITTEFMDDEMIDNANNNVEEVSMSESQSFLEEVTKNQDNSEDQGNDSEVASHFETGETLVTVVQDIPQATTKIARPPSLEFDNKRSSRVSTEYPVSPTGYPQPPTPDFPPPSPSTAVIGIQQKINPLDKRKSRNMETITETAFLEKLLLAEKAKEKKSVQQEDGCTCVPEPDAILEEFVKPYDEDGQDIMCVSGDIDTDSLPLPPPSLTDINCSEESEIIDLGQDGDENQEKPPLEPELKPFSEDMMESNSVMVASEGLLRGSVRGRSRKVKSQICDDVIRRPASGNRRSLNAVLPNMSSSMNVKGDMEKGIETMESMTGGSARVDMWPPGEEHSFDDSEEWAKIAAIMQSFGAGIARESVFVRDYEADFTKLLAGTPPWADQGPGKTKIQSVGEWLEDMSLGQYENTLVANGYDDMDFLGGNIIEDQDLQEIGIKDEKHRRQIIEAAKSLPKVKPISADNMPSSVEEWLRSLHLIEYYDTFISHKYDRMERVQHLWEVELSTVLDIGTIGYRKRLLASLGEKQVPEMTNRNSRSFVPRTEDSTSYYSDIDLFKDYTNLRPSAMMGEEQRKLMPMAGGQSAFLSTQFNGRDTDEVRREGKHIQDESVHIRPPHLAQSTSPVKQWCHKPEVLIKGCCNYIAQYLGSAVVRQLNGTDSTREGIAKMKKSTENTARIPSITLSISYRGVKFIDADSRRVVCEHEIGNIFCACQDSEHLNFFAYITKDKELDKHYCHVFCVRSTDLARNIILTLGQAFEIAYQMALKEKAEEEALEFERKLSLGKDDYAHGSSASHGPQSFA